MTDDLTERHDPDEPHDRNEPHEEAVRRLLADARHTAPLPADVAVRLDGVLADLRADRASTSPETPTAVVVPIGSRRPWTLSRRLTTGLVAAAAVVAAGVALPTLTGGLGASEDSATSAGTADSAASDDGLMRDQGGSAAEAPSGSAEMAAIPTVSPERFKLDASRARPLATASYAAGQGCGTLPAGDVVPVRYEDRDGFLVFGETSSTRQQVTLYLCPGGELVRRARIPVP